MLEWNRRQRNPLKHILYQWRVAKAQLKYFDHIGFRKNSFGVPIPDRVEGYQSKIASLKNIHKKEKCVIIANGPSLQKIKKDRLKKFITIGCNGIYKNFKSWGFETDYLLFEDTVQFEIRSKELKSFKKTKLLASLYNAYCISNDSDWLFFNSPRCKNHFYYEHDYETYPQFSRDFASIVHLGSTVTFIMLQFAYHLGCDPIYIVGLDHNYGELPKIFPPGKIVVTKENIEQVQKCHFNANYYKIGDIMGVPNVKNQNLSYAIAKDHFDEKDVKIFNVCKNTKLTSFEVITEEEFNIKYA